VPAIGYLRVSTQGQVKSGLGFHAQRDAISAFAEAEGYRIATTFEEHESGKGADAFTQTMPGRGFENLAGR
jgi:DNA invertase Pin-like site-specific DNA recombinase